MPAAPFEDEIMAIYVMGYSIATSSFTFSAAIDTGAGGEDATFGATVGMPVWPSGVVGTVIPVTWSGVIQPSVGDQINWNNSSSVINAADGVSSLLLAQIIAGA